MTTQIDDQFTDLLAKSFTAEELATMSANQREWMRDMFFCGFVTALHGAVMDAPGELAQYRQEIGTPASDTKARHCVQEAIMLEKREN